MLGSVNTVDIPKTVDRVDDTAFGDGNKTSLKGYEDGDITFTGFYDINDTVLSQAEASDTSSVWFVYPRYVNDYAHYYAVQGDVSFGFHSEVNGAETITGGHVYATGTAVNAL